MHSPTWDLSLCRSAFVCVRFAYVCIASVHPCIWALNVLCLTFAIRINKKKVPQRMLDGGNFLRRSASFVRYLLEEEAKNLSFQPGIVFIRSVARPLNVKQWALFIIGWHLAQHMLPLPSSSSLSQPPPSSSLLLSLLLSLNRLKSSQAEESNWCALKMEVSVHIYSNSYLLCDHLKRWRESLNEIWTTVQRTTDAYAIEIVPQIAYQSARIDCYIVTCIMNCFVRLH